MPDQLDEAVLRRFNKKILVPLPDKDTRYGLLRALMSKQRCKLTQTDYETIVGKTNGYSCSDITLLCKDAAMGPIRDLGAQILEMQANEMPKISIKHFKDSLKNIRPSVSADSVKEYNDWNKNFGSKMTLQLTALPPGMRPKELPPVQPNTDDDEEEEQE